MSRSSVFAKHMYFSSAGPMVTALLSNDSTFDDDASSLLDEQARNGRRKSTGPMRRMRAI